MNSQKRIKWQPTDVQQMMDFIIKYNGDLTLVAEEFQQCNPKITLKAIRNKVHYTPELKKLYENFVLKRKPTVQAFETLASSPLGSVQSTPYNLRPHVAQQQHWYDEDEDEDEEYEEKPQLKKRKLQCTKKFLSRKYRLR